MFDWNDLKAFLAVARGGSTLAASKALGVNQTTVARRIESLEHDLGFKLFERGQTGSRLTESGDAMIGDAEAVERAAIRFANQAAGQLRGVAGGLRLTTNELVANSMVIPALPEFRKAHPDVQVDLVITDRSLDLENGEADLAIRTAQTLAISDLVARKICDHDMALYCSRDYASRRGVPASYDDLKDHDLIDVTVDMGEMPAATWMMRHSGGKSPITRSNSMGSLVHAVKAGLGIGALPCTIADTDRDMVRCSDCIEEARASSWIVTRRELKDTPRVRAFIDFMAPYLSAQIKLVEERGRMRLAEDADRIVPFPTKMGSGG
ncbi:LysR family transcriptional regulator [Phenylobacterium sp.]|uniref:LysR family transcriptional regulator n=1 Tax=Phenylobacterium sp. TaxID=1871053 RepID=UPI0025D7958B|nr:LysR family transcriptional regulator [Phenylobacterium sp.]